MSAPPTSTRLPRTKYCFMLTFSSSNCNQNMMRTNISRFRPSQDSKIAQFLLRTVTARLLAKSSIHTHIYIYIYIYIPSVPEKASLGDGPYLTICQSGQKSQSDLRQFLIYIICISGTGQLATIPLHQLRLSYTGQPLKSINL